MERLHVSFAGWTRYLATALPPVYLRWTPNDRGRWVLREMFIDASESESLTAASLGRIPISKLEAAVNGDKQTREKLAVRFPVPSPLGGPAAGSTVAVLVSHYATHFGTADTNWVARAQSSTEPRMIDTETGKTSNENELWVERQQQSPGEEAQPDRAYRLTSPPGPDGLSDEFLGRVQRAYVAATLRGEPPNKTIAADVQASPRSVERWVYEARKRGVMPPARAKGARG